MLCYPYSRSLWSADKFLSYVGLDQPPVEPSSEDTCGINRSHVSRFHFVSGFNLLFLYKIFTICYILFDICIATLFVLET